MFWAVKDRLHRLDKMVIKRVLPVGLVLALFVVCCACNQPTSFAGEERYGSQSYLTTETAEFEGSGGAPTEPETVTTSSEENSSKEPSSDSETESASEDDIPWSDIQIIY